MLSLNKEFLVKLGLTRKFLVKLVRVKHTGQGLTRNCFGEKVFNLCLPTFVVCFF